jgi:two-component system C4-dicarboxylate transport response regulator DctD
MLRWQQHDWPGNVRELRNVAERLVLGVVETPSATESPQSLPGRVDAFERRVIEDALRAVDGNVARAAELLQVPRKTLYDKLNRHGLTPAAFARSDPRSG